MPVAAIVKSLDIEDLSIMVRYLKIQLKKLGVKIISGKELKHQKYLMKPDVVIRHRGILGSINIPGCK